MAFQGLQICIEIEILLTPQDPPSCGFNDLEHFSSLIAQRWNRDRAAGMAKMHVDIDGAYEGGNENLEWSVTDDETLKGLENTETGRCKLSPQNIHLSLTQYCHTFQILVILGKKNSIY
jgi:hypothetical protein